MFDRIRHYLRLRQLQERRRFIAAKYINLRLSGREGKLNEDLRDVDQAELRELRVIEDEIGLLQTEFLIAQAERYSLPVPRDNEENWTVSEFRSVSKLSAEALSRLRSAIRAEQKERWEGWYRWLVLVIGLLGSIIGVISVLKK